MINEQKIRQLVDKKKFQEIGRCGYCGRYAAKVCPSQCYRYNYMWGYIKILPEIGICQECLTYFEEKYQDTRLGICSICGEKYRYGENRNRVRKHSEKWDYRKHWHDAMVEVYYTTCHKTECIREMKDILERPGKLSKLRKEFKEYKKELSALRKALKG